ncbi:MAG: trigger factor, partial [Candidatus Gastranaerophilaceae bacterium]
ATFKCKINEIKTKVLPELNDEFAQKVGPFKTVDDLKADIQNYLNKQEEATNKQNSDKAIFEKVLENAEVEISNSMIEREANTLLDEYKQKLTSQGFTWEQAVETQGLDSIMEKINEDAKFRIKNSLVIDKIASLENIKVESDDFNEKIDSLSAMYQMDKETFSKYMLKNPGMLNGLSQQVLNEKVMKFLAENNTVNFVEAKK